MSVRDLVVISSKRKFEDIRISTTGLKPESTINSLTTKDTNKTPIDLRLEA